MPRELSLQAAAALKGPLSALNLPTRTSKSMPEPAETLPKPRFFFSVLQTTRDTLPDG